MQAIYGFDFACVKRFSHDVVQNDFMEIKKHSQIHLNPMGFIKSLENNTINSLHIISQRHQCCLITLGIFNTALSHRSFKEI